MREASLRTDILDHQVVDSEDLPLGRVDDVELDLSGASGKEPRVTLMLCGQEPLGERLGGLTGGLLARMARRLRGSDGFSFTPDDVEEWEPLVKLRSRFADLDAAPLEKWLSNRVVGHLPGASDAGE